MAKKTTSEQRRKWRVRNTLKKAVEKNGRCRLSVNRTGKHIYAQIIDDVKGITLAAASTGQAAIKDGLKTTANVEAAQVVGKKIAELAKKAGVEKVMFDRGASAYHGRVKALADAAREAGLVF